MKKILLLSAYDALSHRLWRQTVVEGLPQYQWTVLTLPARHFSWRIRGNALSWSMTEVEALADRYDLILATSMTDLATLKGLVPGLATTPAMVYFHENQFDYPLRGARGALEAQMVTLYAALAADSVVFNSAYNRSGFLRGAGALLKKLPDCVPGLIVPRLAERCTVLPVPIRHGFFEQRPDPPVESALNLLWNHRWEYDKGPDRLLTMLKILVGEGLDFTIRIIGQQFRNAPVEFEAMRALLGGRLLTWGHVEDRCYLSTLQRSDVVLSTALHDFQGLAVLEATAAGNVPLVPDRLAYREWFADRFRYESSPRDIEREARAMVDQLVRYKGLKDRGGLVAPDVRNVSWAELGPGYNNAIDLLIN